jgi:PBP1b-binding outer membrane lipoprotein LpoB
MKKLTFPALLTALTLFAFGCGSAEEAGTKKVDDSAQQVQSGASNDIGNTQNAPVDGKDAAPDDGKDAAPDDGKDAAPDDGKDAAADDGKDAADDAAHGGGH